MLGGPYWMRCVGTMLLSIPGSGGDLLAEPTAVQRRAQARIAAELAAIGFALPAASWSGQPPAARPAAAARGTLRKVAEDQRRRYQGWFDNARRLHRLVTELEALSIEALAE